MEKEIYHINDNILWSGEATSMKEACEIAVKQGVSLASADLSYMDLSGADLSGANLSSIKEDFFKVLSAAMPEEVGFLREELVHGHIDGSQYDGECSCLKGTIARKRGVPFKSMEGILAPDFNSPSERWFLGIRKGMSVDHPMVKITIGWIDEWSNC